MLSLDRPVQARSLRSLHRLAAAPRSAANVKALKGDAKVQAALDEAAKTIDGLLAAK